MYSFPPRQLSKTVFSIHLSETEDGLVIVHADCVEGGDNALSIGMDLLQSLSLMGRVHNNVQIESFNHLEYFQ
jgi:hypothetical protein